MYDKRTMYEADVDGSMTDVWCVSIMYTQELFSLLLVLLIILRQTDLCVSSTLPDRKRPEHQMYLPP